MNDLIFFLFSIWFNRHLTKIPFVTIVYFFLFFLIYFLIVSLLLFIFYFFLFVTILFLPQSAQSSQVKSANPPLNISTVNIQHSSPTPRAPTRQSHSSNENFYPKPKEEKEEKTMGFHFKNCSFSLGFLLILSKVCSLSVFLISFFNNFSSCSRWRE
ncbi:hypothetical protein Pfo_025545 [Paulownia fortunei]|nr:hypothetical protein Pfo_025545 [Paulownia fortunei]